jgi:hypothetical protein
VITYLQRTTRQPAKHRAPARRTRARKTSHALSFLSLWPGLATGRHPAGLIASAVLLVAGTGLAVWAVLR